MVIIEMDKDQATYNLQKLIHKKNRKSEKIYLKR